MRRRDPDLSLDTQGGGSNCPPLALAFATAGGRQKLQCWNTQGVFRLIQSIPSPRAEPFKRWLAKVGKERLDEIENPELTMGRMQELYEKKGYPKEWIDKRLRSIAVRQDLTDEWKRRGVASSQEFAILTNEIMHGTFALKVDKYKQVKALARENLRDHMTDIELILTMLAEATTTKQLQQGLAQLGEEGAIQVFRPEMGGNMLLGAVGQLQFEVVQHRLKGEYDADVRLESSQYTGARWITADTLAYLCTSPYDVRLAQERFPKIHFHPLREHARLAPQSAS